MRYVAALDAAAPSAPASDRRVSARVTVVLPSEQMARLRIAAEKRGLSINFLAITAIEQLVKDLESSERGSR